MIDREMIAVFYYDDGGSNRLGAEPYRYAEEIIRCKECKYWEGEERNGFYYFEICSRTKLDALSDDFCSYGERSDT